MDIEAMNCFLSRENIEKHLEHVRQARLRLSVLEKSFPCISGAKIAEIKNANIDRKAKGEALWLKKYVKSHELFFNSFSLNGGRCEKIKKYYSSREGFIYEIFRVAREMDSGFLFVHIDGKRGPKIDFSSDLSAPFTKYEPNLALDLYEHTYFADYGFLKDKFLKNALSYFNIEAIDAKLS